MIGERMTAICKSCGNSGTDVTGDPCVCKLTPEWQHLVGELRRGNGRLANDVERQRTLLAHALKHLTHCKYDRNGLCEAHHCPKPCLTEKIAEELTR